eukprot:CAMPEP_0171270148 /NCGR_PEP_ID=MMETSP0790-20130122/60558_1 /TAXON_ID=2925 /ORGANISM="Alexandrium catenella, Strain OF101" /LENGTH=82 /DNA_ID=CAMNT_0011738973 /DNA_START=40 /DNA_END=285 /DNA_ORIENTATION=-
MPPPMALSREAVGARQACALCMRNGGSPTHLYSAQNCGVRSPRSSTATSSSDEDAGRQAAGVAEGGADLANRDLREPDPGVR